MSTERTLENVKVFSVLLCEVSEESRTDRARVSDWLASSSNNTHDIKRFKNSLTMKIKIYFVQNKTEPDS